MVQKIMYYLFDICWIFGLALSCILAAQVHPVPDGPDRPTAIVSKVGADAPVECNQKASRRKAGQGVLFSFSLSCFSLCSIIYHLISIILPPSSFLTSFLPSYFLSSLLPSLLTQSFSSFLFLSFLYHLCDL